MNTTEQKHFIKELTKAITAEMEALIDKGKVPEEWDGIELRQWIEDRYAACVFKGYMLGKRKREYKQTVLENNL